MKFIIALVLTALLSFIASLRFDWWIIAIMSFIVALLVHQTAWKSFLAGFLGLFLLWGILAEWIDIANKGILSKKIATVLPLGGNALLLILITGIVGGLVAGFAAMSASYLRKE